MTGAGQFLTKLDRFPQPLEPTKLFGSPLVLLEFSLLKMHETR